MMLEATGGGVCPTITGEHQSSISDYTAIVLQTMEDEETNGNTKSGRTPGKLIINDEMLMEHRTNSTDSVGQECGGAQRMPDKDNFNAVIDEPCCMSDRKGHNGITQDGTATTLNAQEKERPVVAACDFRNGLENPDTNGTPQCKENGGQSLNYQNSVRTCSIVRRLTPTECERLQGFPDGWTDIGEWTDTKGKKHKEADSPRYKALGNAIALPFWKWLAKRIVAQYDEPTTMASLFDGIGGFPIAFEEAGCKAVWASEIEEFPIAVTKIRFPEKDTNDNPAGATDQGRYPAPATTEGEI